MSIHYWEFEDAPLKEKLKAPNVREVAKIFFDNETKAYRFARVLTLVKERPGLKLKDCPSDLPLATWKRYLDFGVRIGILKHENSSYSFTDRYSKPFKNIPVYIKAWIDMQSKDDLDTLFVNARTGKQQKRGGRQSEQGAAAKDTGAVQQSGAETPDTPDDISNEAK